MATPATSTLLSSLPMLYSSPSSSSLHFSTKRPSLHTSPPLLVAARLGSVQWPYSHQYQSLQSKIERRRGEVVVVRAGPPSTTNLIFAFVFPLSLIIGTIFASIRIADNLDEQYMEELAMNQAIMEEKEAEEDVEDGEEEDDDGEEEEESEAAIELQEEAAVVEVAAAPRTRNRPKKQV